MKFKFNLIAGESALDAVNRFRRDLAKFAVAKQAYHATKSLEAVAPAESYRAEGNASMANEFANLLRSVEIG